MKEIIIFEPPDTVVLLLSGNLPADDVKNMFVKWAEYVKPGEKSKVLIDASTLEDIPPKTREVLREGANNFPMSKLAIFGATTKMRIMGGLIIKMVPGVDKSTFVKTEEEARAWLQKEK